MFKIHISTKPLSVLLQRWKIIRIFWSRKHNIPIPAQTKYHLAIVKLLPRASVYVLHAAIIYLMWITSGGERPFQSVPFLSSLVQSIPFRSVSNWPRNGRTNGYLCTSQIVVGKFNCSTTKYKNNNYKTGKIPTQDMCVQRIRNENNCMPCTPFSHEIVFFGRKLFNIFIII